MCFSFFCFFSALPFFLLLIFLCAFQSLQGFASRGGRSLKVSASLLRQEAGTCNVCLFVYRNEVLQPCTNIICAQFWRGGKGINIKVTHSVEKAPDVVTLKAPKSSYSNQQEYTHQSPSAFFCFSDIYMWLTATGILFDFQKGRGG